MPRNAFSGLVAASSLMLSSTAALAAEGPRYTYGELDYSHLDFDQSGGFDGDGDGLGLVGSFAVTEMFFVAAGLATYDIDVDGSNVEADYDTYALGGGINYAISNTIDLVGEIAWIRAELDVGDADEDGYGVSAGARAMLRPQWEVNGSIDYVDLDSSDTGISVGTVYNFTPVFAVTAGISLGDDVTSYGVGVRAYFGDR